MKYSYTWLQSHIEDPLPTPEVLKDMIIFHAFEVEDIEIVDGDTIFDIKVLPDRAGDCLSHYGMAREIAGLLDLNFITSAYTTPSIADAVVIDIQTNDCLRYSAVRIDSVRVTPSPDWLVKKLEAVGQRSINNVVDATNFILLDLGQPTHVFDADKVHGAIVVRAAKEGETITLLGGDPLNPSGQAKTLKEGMMVIADSTSSPQAADTILAIAGVKGGTAAEVTMETTSIILEIASFDAASVRKTARMLGLPTDASKRFENNLSPHTVEMARAKLVGLVQILTGGTVVAIGDQYPAPQLQRALSFTVADIQALLGMTITDNSITNVFDRYGYTYSKEDPSNPSGQVFYTLDIPFWRQDITGAHDLVEEIGRVIGYETIPAAPLPFVPVVLLNGQYEKIRAIKYALVEQGYSEVMNYTFRKKGDVYIAYGPKDKSGLRTNLSDGLKESYEMNKLNAPLLGILEVKLFEIGTVFTADGSADASSGATKESMHIATADKDGVKEYDVDEYVLPAIVSNEAAAAQSGIPYGNAGVAPFRPWSVYPFITRDIAVWITDDTAKATLQTIVDDFAEKNCVRPATLFDTFSKENKTSLAYRFVFQSKEKTLTDSEIEPIFQKLVSTIKTHSEMIIR